MTMVPTRFVCARCGNKLEATKYKGSDAVVFSVPHCDKCLAYTNLHTVDFSEKSPSGWPCDHAEVTGPKKDLADNNDELEGLREENARLDTLVADKGWENMKLQKQVAELQEKLGHANDLVATQEDVVTGLRSQLLGLRNRLREMKQTPCIDTDVEIERTDEFIVVKQGRLEISLPIGK